MFGSSGAESLCVSLRCRGANKLGLATKHRVSHLKSNEGALARKFLPETGNRWLFVFKFLVFFWEKNLIESRLSALDSRTLRREKREGEV